MNRIQRILRRFSGLHIRSDRAFEAFIDGVRGTDTFIVSCSKSGTTWLAFLLAHCFHPELDEEINLRSSTQFIPDINRLYLGKGYIEREMLRRIRKLRDPRVFRVHAPFDLRFSKVIYLLRDPRSVVLSQWHYMRGRDSGFSLSLYEFVKRGDCGVKWEDSVRQWLFEEEHPQLKIVRYEDLLTDPHAELGRVIDFLGIAVSPSLIEIAVRRSSFGRMVEMEKRTGAAEGQLSRGERFVRRGKADGWRDEFDEATLRASEERFGPYLFRLGYESEYPHQEPGR